ncbi:hybrid sensor histidine kinase/response regulator transcription factor [Confluentibacter flavum]|uniref:histidine kinase n=1 Tax=Confluentibacter flavum TaxID=1909700 RepID=A0A2N3HF38_9FLAO|nr:two-component regulator propeller domain-containing protein [Confluentibacter flavum]PKQ43586.1 hypothetical protein CSW08_16395 [Confluentibacter flavum]
MILTSNFKRQFLVLGLFLAVNLFAIKASGQSQNTAFIPVAPDILSNAYISSIFKDSKGFMWFGTKVGLMRYDGSNVFRYEHDPQDSTSISHNNINIIAESPNHELWIGTAVGLCKYDREKESFINFNSIPNNKGWLDYEYITNLVFDSYGKLWIGTYGGGLYIYDLEDKKLTNAEEGKLFEANSKDHFVTSLLYSGDRVWCGTMDGFNVFNASDGTLVHSNIISGHQIKNQVSSIVEDQKGNIWLSGLNGDLIKATNNNGQYVLEKVISNDGTHQGPSNTLALYGDNEGNIWLGGENSGLNYFNTKSNKIIRFGPQSNEQKALPTAYIRSIFIDDMANIWVGTFSHGVFMIDNTANRFEAYGWGNVKPNDIAGKEVTSFAEDNYGNVWMACNSMGLIRLDVKTNKLNYYEGIKGKFASIKITSMVFDASNNLWISTGEGLYKLRTETKAVKKYSLISKGFGDNKPSVLFEDRKGIVWAGTYGSGLFYHNKETDEFVSLKEEQQTNSISNISFISSLAEDSKGSLWVGTLYGLYELTRLNNHSFNYNVFYQNKYNPNGLNSNVIQSLVVDAEDNLWIGTADSGLNMKKKGDDFFKSFRKKDGLAGDMIRGLVTDASDNLWISSNMGLAKFNPETTSFKKYTKSDGLLSNSFLDNASLATSKGKLFFGNNKGMNVFYPDSISITPSIPKMYFTDLKINNKHVGIDEPNSPLDKPIGLTQNIELSYEQRSFTLNFAAINFEPSYTYDYCYMLEGFDKEWICIGSGTSASYTNIDPGNYVFLVKVLSQGESMDVSPLSLGITIKPIIWLTWWAKLFYLVLIGSIIFFFVNLRIERIKIRNQLAVEKLAREKDHELLESKTQFFTNISHEFRTPLSLIAMPLEKLMGMEELPKSVKKGLKTIQNSSGKMLRLINELMDFSKMESAKLGLSVQERELVSFIKGLASSFYDLAEKKNISFEVNTTESHINGWFDHDKLEKVLINLLSNAFKFTPHEGRIRLLIDLRHKVGENANQTRFIEIQVTDTGIGIPENELPLIFDKFYQATSTSKIDNSGTGIGLSLTKGLIKLHRGSIKVESKFGDKTSFIIQIPIDKQSYFDNEIIENPIPLGSKQVAIIDQQDYIEEEHSHEATDIDRSKSAILIVEDNDELRNYLAMELGNYFTVIEAINGKQGYEKALEAGPDLIVSDIAMPVKTGTEFCNDIKSNLETSHIPFILLTAKTSIDDQVLGIGFGADVYITKPFSIRFLIAQVNQIIDSRQKLYAQFSQNVYLMPNMVAKNDIDKAFLQKAIDYIVENIQDSEIGVTQMAEVFNLSHKQIYRKIKALTGKSVVGFIRIVRVKEALKLMEAQNYTLKEIAYMTGFNSASYFTTSFKEEYGRAPSEFLDQRFLD